MGVDVSYDAPQTTDMVAMSRMIDAAVTQKVQGLVVSIPDAEALQKSVKGAVAAGIPVIVIDSGEDEVPESRRQTLRRHDQLFRTGRVGGEEADRCGREEGRLRES